MRKFTTVMLALLMAVTSYHIAGSDNSSDDLYPQNALHAATVPNWNYNGQLPLDVKLDLAKAIKPDTVVIHDTVTVNNTKYVRVPVPRHTTDTIFVPLADLPEVECVAVKNRSPGDREENSLDESVAKTGIVLIVDGNTVYSSKNENHSGRDDENISVSADEP
jgi:hypothetical protein